MIDGVGEREFVHAAGGYGPPGGGYPPGGGGGGYGGPPGGPPPGGGGYGGPPGGGGYGGPPGGGPPGFGPPGGAPPGGYGAPPGGYGQPPGGFGPPPGGGGFGPPGYMPQNGPKVHPLAIVSLVFGILSIPLCCCSFFGIWSPIAAIVCGIIALNKIKEQPQLFTGNGLCIAGIATGGVGIMLDLVAMFSTFDDMLKSKYGHM